MSEAASHRPAEAIYPSQALAANLRRLRKLRRLSQQDVAERMTALQYGRAGKPGGRSEARTRSWNRSTVGEIERGSRGVETDELVGLSLILGSTLGELLDPGERRLYLGDVLPLEQNGAGGEGYDAAPGVRAEVAREWFRSRMRGELVEADSDRLRIRSDPADGRWTDELLAAVGVHVIREDAK